MAIFLPKKSYKISNFDIDENGDSADAGGDPKSRLAGVGRWYSRAMRALLVEDDHIIADFVARGLREAGFAVDRATDGEDGLQLATTAPYDVAIVDVMLPKLDGLSLIKELRRRHITTPVLILSARHTVDDRVSGLEAGSDD